MEFNDKALSDLKKAKMLLENPGFPAKITNILGTPIEKGLELLPDNYETNFRNRVEENRELVTDSSSHFHEHIVKVAFRVELVPTDMKEEMRQRTRAWKGVLQ